MASRNNPYQRDPALAAAFSNIAGMFAPPSGSDAAGFATANAKRAEAQRLADLFAYSKDLSYDRGAFERQAIAAGIYNPSQSFYSVDQGNATTQRGQDITARTAVGNNIRDNSTKAFQTRYGALSEGQVLPAMPGSVAGMYGLPESGVVAGSMKLSQGQDAVLPDGQRVEGPRKPLSETEMKAAILGRQPEQAQTDYVMGGQAPVVAVGPDGKTPIYVAPGVAGRMQMPAAAAPSSTPQRRSEGVAIIGDQQVPVTRSPDGLQWQLPDGQPVPPGARVMDLPKATGSNEQLGLPTTANRTEANRLDATIVGTEDMLNKYEAILKNSPGVIGLPGAIRGVAQDAVSTLAELGAAFGNMAPDAKVTLDQVQGLAQRISPARDPNIQIARSLAMSLAYQDAQLQNPSGEVSRQAFERSYEKLTGGMLRNNQSALESVQGMRMLMDSKRKQTGALNKPGTPSPTSGTPAPAAAPAPATRLRFDANGNPL